MNKQMKKNKKGFTLVEMIVVIAIIGVLAAMMVPSLIGYIDKANTSNNRAAATNIARTAQVVLVELNDSEINGTYAAKADITNSTGIEKTKDLDANKDGGFDAAIREMMEKDKFKGSFAIKITNGTVEKVNYRQDDKCEDISTTTLSSTSEIGVYPE